jgi:hypothetical protein
MGYSFTEAEVPVLAFSGMSDADYSDCHVPTLRFTAPILIGSGTYNTLYVLKFTSGLQLQHF